MVLKFWHNNAYDTITAHDGDDNLIESITVDDDMWEQFSAIIASGEAPHCEWDQTGPGADWVPDPECDQLVAVLQDDGDLLIENPERWNNRLRFYGDA